MKNNKIILKTNEQINNKKKILNTILYEKIGDFMLRRRFKTD